MSKASLYYKLVLATLVATVLLITPKPSEAAAFATCVYCVGGEMTCQPAMEQAVCSLCVGGTNPVYCAYDSEPTCSWDEVVLVCGSGNQT
jgi:hypothetical protein